VFLLLGNKPSLSLSYQAAAHRTGQLVLSKAHNGCNGCTPQEAQHHVHVLYMRQGKVLPFHLPLCLLPSSLCMSNVRVRTLFLSEENVRTPSRSWRIGSSMASGSTPKAARSSTWRVQRTLRLGLGLGLSLARSLARSLPPSLSIRLFLCIHIGSISKQRDVDTLTHETHDTTIVQ
jgi:hypothetical protein